MQSVELTPHTNYHLLTVLLATSLAGKLLLPVLVSTQYSVMLEMIWVGMLLGISFLESWVKFRAQLAERHVALDIGRLVFFRLNQAEMIIATVLVILSHQTALIDWIPLMLLFLQVSLLQPILDQSGRFVIKETLIQKKKVHSKRPFIHVIYVVFEVIKLVCLVVSGLRAHTDKL